jgi:hypothetical protein
MGLLETIQDATVTALAAVGNLAQPVTYRSLIDSTVTPATGVVKSFNTYQTTGVPIDFTAQELEDNEYERTDQKLLMAARDLTFTPKKSDEVSVGGDLWRVLETTIDPANALWTLVLRRIA